MEPTHLNCDKVEDCFDKEICLEGVKCDCDEGLCKHKECDEDSDCNNPHHCREVVFDKSFIDHQNISQGAECQCLDRRCAILPGGKFKLPTNLLLQDMIEESRRKRLENEEANGIGMFKRHKRQ